MDHSAQAITRYAINQNDVEENGRYTNPRSYGVYLLPANSPTNLFYRFGNHPVRMQELRREFGDCELKYLFKYRQYAMELASILNSKP